MNKLSKEKRQQLLLVALVTAMVLGGLGWGLVRSQQLSLRRLAERKATAQQKLQAVKQAIDSADRIEAELAETSARLAKAEEGMASGDLFSWAVNSIRQFKLPYKVEIPQYGQIEGPIEMPLLPKFPYKQASLSVVGTAQFYDFGRFIADLENQFPHIRVHNLILEAGGGDQRQPGADTPADREKLAFRMDIVWLVKPTAS